jgi:hypothetical protein
VLLIARTLHSKERITVNNITGLDASLKVAMNGPLQGIYLIVGTMKEK